MILKELIKMKFVISLSIFILLMAGITAADTLETVQPSPFLIVVSTADDAALDANDTSWKTAFTWPEIPKGANSLKIAFYAYDSEDGNTTADSNTFNAQIYIADFGGSGQLVCDTNATIGKMQLSHSPITSGNLLTYGFASINTSGDPNSEYTWVDTLSTPATAWKGSVTAQNGAGTDDMASLIFDRQSGKRIWCRIYGRSSSYLTIWCIGWYY